MSVLFKDKDDVYKWLVSIEQEREELRDMNVVYAERSADNYRNYEKVRKRAITSMRRVNAHKIKEVDKKSIETLVARHQSCVQQRMKHKTMEDEASFLYEHPVRPQSHGWPVRKSSAARVFAPKKLGELKEFEDVLRPPKDQPIIHSTGLGGRTTPQSHTSMHVRRPQTAPLRRVPREVQRK